MYVAPQGVPLFAAILDRLESWLEAERERVALWVPVALGVGILAWYALLDAQR